MKRNESQLLNRSFRQSTLAIVFFALTVVWVSLSLEILNLNSTVVGVVSGLAIVLFLYFNIAGAINTYRSKKKKFLFTGGRKAIVILNLALSLVPLLFVLMILAEILGADLFKMMN